MLATLCLNEMEWLPRLYEQHKDWPDLVGWVFVEAADPIYAAANPDRVSPDGLSVDGTTDYLRFLETDPRVTVVRHGWTRHRKINQNKCQARQQYLTESDRIRPEFIMVLDADEFYSRDSQCQINDRFQSLLPKAKHRGFRFRQRHIWRPPSVADQPLFQSEVVGAYWDIPHTRGWRWQSGLRYDQNHNWPNDRHGNNLGERSYVYCDDLINPNGINCTHLGFASSLQSRVAKHQYYIDRGEGRSDRRQMYVDCRRAFELWQPNQPLPHGAKVVPYAGEIPEVFQQRHAEQTQ